MDDVIQAATAKDPALRTATVAELVARLAEAAGGPPQSPAPPGAIRSGGGVSTRVSGLAANPYKGLRPFAEADAADFAGRDRLADRLVDQLRRPAPAGRFLAVVGPSGSGKSSVVRAGLLPALRAGRVAGSERWFVTTMVPGAHPFEELESALARIAAERAAGWSEVITADERGIARAVKQLLPDEDSELVIVVDQFEELFTLCDDETVRRRFVRGLASAVTDPRSLVRFVVAMRADFWDRPLRYPELAPLLDQAALAVGPLAPDELERAIVDPAARAGVEFEPGLVSQIVADVADQPGALPMLQYALTELYDRQVSGLLTLDAYRSLGGVGALARRAEALYGEAEPAQQAATRRLFNRLVTLGEGVEDTRRRVVRSELGADPATEAVIERYGAARLLSFDRDPVTREPTVEVAHEALIRQWPRLRAWLDDDRDGLRIHRHLTDAARAWAERGRDPAELYRGARLDAATDWLSGERGEDLNATEAEFLSASRTARDEQQADLRRTNRRLQALLSGVGVALVAALVAGGLAFGQQRRANRNADRADQSAAEAASQADLVSRQQASGDVSRLVAESRVAQGSNLATAALLAVEADRRDDSPQTRGALQSALLSSPETLAYLAPGGTRINWLSVSGDGLRLVTGGYDGTVTMFEPLASPGAPATSLTVAPSGRVGREISADGRRLISVDEQGTVRTWDVASQALLGEPAPFRAQLGLGYGITRPFAHPLRPTVFIVTGDGTVVEVPDELGTVLHRYRPEGTMVGIAAAAVSGDGRRLVTVDAQGLVTLFDVDSSTPINQFRASPTPRGPYRAKLSGDGVVVLLTLMGDPESVVTLDTATGRRLAVASTGNGAGPGAALGGSPLSLFVLSATGTLSVTDLTTGQVVRTTTVSQVGASADLVLDEGRQRLYVADSVGAIPVLSIGGERKLARGLGFQSATVRTSPDGTSMATQALDGAPELRDPRTGALRFTLRPPEWTPIPRTIQILRGPAYSPDSRYVAFFNAGSIYLYETAGGSLVRRLAVPALNRPADSTLATTLGPAGGRFATFVTISSDNRYLAAGRYDSVVVYDLDSGALLHELVGWGQIVTTIEFAPDRPVFAAASLTGDAWLIDAASGDRIGAPLGQRGTKDIIWQARWAPDGRTLALGNAASASVVLLDAETRQLRSGNPAPFTSAAAIHAGFGEEGAMLAVLVSNGLQLVDVASGSLIGTPFPGLPETHAAFSTAGKELVARVRRVWSPGTSIPSRGGRRPVGWRGGTSPGRSGVSTSPTSRTGSPATNGRRREGSTGRCGGRSPSIKSTAGDFCDLGSGPPDRSHVVDHDQEVGITFGTFVTARQGAEEDHPLRLQCAHHVVDDTR